LVGIIGLCYLIEMFIAPIDWSAAASHTVLPQLADGDALLLAVGIIGAKRHATLNRNLYFDGRTIQKATPALHRVAFARLSP
jgi:manganese transport protein